ncbi:unnamed protein product [Darwinula stevensoni]|uniref:C1q domain-containing protein n=1 Tax=Darwinula stevensoni TaxID=69355 RepID=A0A7R9FPX2_9CRUS|nr:unnamed protein product [Darwinula stevensoni]CAG0898617.1 unnamed protein product [Darwinula stevensoni]
MGVFVSEPVHDAQPSLLSQSGQTLHCFLIWSKKKFPIHPSDERANFFHLEKMMSAVIGKNEELANDIAQLKLVAENLKQENEDLRNSYGSLRRDNENLRHQNGILGQKHESLRHDHESFRSRVQGYFHERDQMKLENAMEDRLEYLEALSLQITPRSCNALANLGVSKTGTYLVDPDGALIGESPIKVLCDMEADPVTTVVQHDSMESTYEAFSKQMTSLIDQSESCEKQHGGLVCRGEAPRPENPATSCSSLRRAGNTRTGYHLISRKKGRLDVVLCQMDLDETDPKFQVETSALIQDGAVIFDAFRRSDYITENAVIRYESTEVNVGDAMDPNTGIFTAPIAGIYSFSFHYYTDDFGLVHIRQNELVKAAMYTFYTSDLGEYDVPGQSVVLQLAEGDTVDVYLFFGKAMSNTDRYVHFVGYLLTPL